MKNHTCPSMPHRARAITPSQQAIDGALAIYAEGRGKGDERQMLFGLSVLRSATNEQLRTAMPVLQTHQGMSTADVQALFVA